MNPYNSIWINPRVTFAEVADREKQSILVLPIIGNGLIFGLDAYPDIASLFAEGEKIWAFFLALPFGVGLSFLMLGFIIPSLIRLSGKIWKGESTLRKMVNVCSLSFLPFSFILLYQVSFFSFGGDPKVDSLNYGVVYLFWLWSFGLLIIGVAKTQRFTYGVAFLNILISYLPFLILGLLRS